MTVCTFHGCVLGYLVQLARVMGECLGGRGECIIREQWGHTFGSGDVFPTYPYGRRSQSGCESKSHRATHRHSLGILILQQESPLPVILAPVQLDIEWTFLHLQLPFLCIDRHTCKTLDISFSTILFH